jgi:C-terminal processing protease CtpA/Prc
MDQQEFRAYMNREKGLYEGIGVELALEMHGAKPAEREVHGASKAKVRPSEIGVLPPPQDAEEAVATMSRFPTVKVVAVVPGGPADKAGVKVGDIVADVDGHWVVEDSLLDKFKKARDAFSAKKLSFAEIEPLQKELRDKTERALLPARTLPRLLVGTSGTVQVTWNRNGVERSTTIVKAPSQMPVADSTSSIVLPMSEAGEMALKSALHGQNSATIDLRNDPSGSFSSMIDCLKLLARTGRYGEIENHRSEDPTPISVESGNPNPPKLSILVGPSTRGPAAVLALALSTHAKATLVGQLDQDSIPVTQDIELPDGSGYDLLIGVYRAMNPKSEMAKHPPASPGKVSDNRSLAEVRKGALAQRGKLPEAAAEGSDKLAGGVN